jgi:hypothetical protein
MIEWAVFLGPIAVLAGIAVVAVIASRRSEKEPEPPADVEGWDVPPGA